MRHLKPVAVLVAVSATTGLDAAASHPRLTGAVERRSPARVATVFTQGDEVSAVQPADAPALDWARSWHDLPVGPLFRPGAGADTAADHGVSRFARALGSAAITTCPQSAPDAMPLAQVNAARELLQKHGATEYF